MEQRWPRFELVKIGLTPGVPGQVADVLAAGVPAELVGREYQALPETELAGANDQLVAFGSAGLFGRICVEPATGRIVQVPTTHSEQVNSVNADLPAFTTCVQVAFDRFPFYARESESEDWDAVAKELEATLAAIDSVTLAHVGFWEAFVSDMSDGAYTTEDILADD
jgi:hypothetical protein